MTAKSKREKQPQSSITNALDSFNATVSNLGCSYDVLKKEIQDLNLQLEGKNRQLEENLYEVNRLRRFLDSILNSMTDGVIVVDTVGKIILFNGGAEKLTGFRSEEVLGELYQNVFGKKVSKRFSPLYTMASGEALFLEEKEIKSKLGSFISVRYSTSLLTDNHNQAVGAVEVISDLTRIKRLEKEMQQIKTQTALNQMAALVAHEIRNPLGGIRGYVDLLAESIEAKDPRRSMLENINTSIRRLDEIVANFQLFTRPVKPHLEVFDICKFVEEVANYFERSTGFGNLGIRQMLHCPDSTEGVCVMCDPVLLEQALFMIMDNSVKAMPQGGTLRIEIQVTPLSKGKSTGRVNIIISDTGVGIPDTVLGDIFTPFFTTREKGMGLGLSLARNFISVQHGDILIDSEEGAGTSVTIVLPLEERKVQRDEGSKDSGR